MSDRRPRRGPRASGARSALSSLAAQLARAAAALPLVAFLTACTTWHRADVASAPVTGPAWEHVRVTRTDGGQVELWTARVARDTLFGLAYPRWGKAMPPTTAVPVASIRTVEVRGIHSGRTTGLLGGVAAVGALTVAALVGSLLLILSALDGL